ncbi:UNVERIFIED_CONTAM: hypothetical protein HDU68_003161 [Siphonaria sp. JEL0065]|nr:hypothetical protein HDU68_003161 [Siphonaria sp. JEL0065]
MPSNTLKAISQLFNKTNAKNKSEVQEGDQQKLVLEPTKQLQRRESITQIMSGSSKLCADKPPVFYTYPAMGGVAGTGKTL